MDQHDTPAPPSRRRDQPATLGQLAAAVTILSLIVGAAVFAGMKIGSFESSESARPILIDRRDREEDTFRIAIRSEMESFDRRLSALESRSRQ